MPKTAYKYLFHIRAAIGTSLSFHIYYLSMCVCVCVILKVIFFFSNFEYFPEKCLTYVRTAVLLWGIYTKMPSRRCTAKIIISSCRAYSTSLVRNFSRKLYFSLCAIYQHVSNIHFFFRWFFLSKIRYKYDCKSFARFCSGTYPRSKVIPCTGIFNCIAFEIYYLFFIRYRFYFPNKLNTRVKL